jgi:fatty acid desaturase
VVFCLVMQGVFSLMHDCFHGHGHPDPTANRLLGVALAAIFGTAFTLHRVNHGGHHVRSRSRAEMPEYIFPGESAARKRSIYYFAILGGSWLGSFLAALVLPLVPFGFVKRLNRPASSMNSNALAFADFTAADWRALRVDSGIAVAWWGAAILIFDWQWQVLLLAYACFAFSWSSLQWVYHLRTPLDPVEGAYDLRLPRPVRWLFLNFNYNLTHHREPALPWQQLHAAVDQRETQPLWYRYLRVFTPPERLPEDPASITKVYF